MPALQITDTPALPPTRRACAYIVVVTSGLRESLGDDELEAVLAHALTHIRNRDTQLMVVRSSLLASSLFSATLRSETGISSHLP